MKLSKSLLVTTVAATAATSAVFVAGPASASPTIAGTYNSVSPTRVVDTRAGTGAPKATIGAGQTLTFSVAAKLPSPLVSAEALTVTAVNETALGYLTVYPGATTRPATSTLNFTAKHTVANAAIVSYGAAGAVSVYNGSKGTVDLVVDLTGYWTGGAVSTDTAGAYQPVTGARLLDTRTSTPIAANGNRQVLVSGTAGIPSTGVSAIVVNLTVPESKALGFLTATANATDEQDSSRTSDVSFTAGETRANLVVVPVDPQAGAISLFDGSRAAINAVIDVVGYFSDGAPSDDGSFVSSTPARYPNTDTRSGVAVAANSTVKVDFGVGGDPTSVFKAVAATVTLTDTSSLGYLTAWSGVSARPTTSILNFDPKRTVSSSAFVDLNSDGTISIYNGSTSSVNVIVDVHGFVLNDLSGMSPAAAQARIHSALNRAHKVAVARVH